MIGVSGILYESKVSMSARIVELLCVLLTAGCIGVQQPPSGERPSAAKTQTAATPSKAPVVEAIVPAAAPPVARSTGEPAVNAESSAQRASIPRAQPGESPPSVAAPVAKAAVEPIVATVAPSVTPQPAANTASPAAKPAAKVVAAPPPAKPVPQKESIAQAPAKPETAPPLDLKSLETRLKETKAIGVFTKLALKNQVDDLLSQFRAYYQGQRKTTLSELRRPYDMLLLKVLALLQDADPPLAGAIVASREAIWSILADPAKFSAI